MPFLSKERLKNFRTYLFEVLVIFTGITASFLFDEWRQDKERIQLERNYLERLDADLNNDIASFESMTAHSSEQLNFCQIAMKAFNDNHECDTIFSYITGIFLLEINDYTINEMQNTGAFYSIQNIELKNEILDYYHRTDEMQKVYDLVLARNDQIKSELRNHLKLVSEKNNFGTFQVHKPVSDNLILENLIYEKKNLLEFLIMFGPDLISKAEKLRNNIKKELLY